MSNNNNDKTMCCMDCMKDRCKSRLGKLLPERLKYCEKVDELYSLRIRLTLLRQLYNEEKKRMEEMEKELELLVRSNNRRDDRLTRVRQRDYSNKYKMAESECHKKKLQLDSHLSHLQVTRKCLIETFVNKIFHMTSSSIESNIPSMSLIGTTTQHEERRDNILDFEIVKTGHEQRQPMCYSESSLNHIGYGFLPNSDLLTDYLQGNYKVKFEEEEQHTQLDINHLTDRSRGLSAALSLIGHCVVLLSTILNQPLPHPLILPIVLCEYGKVDKSLTDIICLLAKLDDNIILLCFTQNIDHNELTSGNTISNLQKLINSKELGRTGSFICHPELLRYPQVRTHTIEPMSDWENEPPLLHVAQTQYPTIDQPSCSTNNTTSDIIYNNTDISEGWEEIQDRIVPSLNYYGTNISHERLEYGVSYSDYVLQRGQQYPSGHDAIKNDRIINGDDAIQNDRLTNSRSSSGISSSIGLFDTLGNLFGSSGWIKKQ